MSFEREKSRFWMSFPLVTNLTDVNRIGEQFVERAPRKAPLCLVKTLYLQIGVSR